MIQQLGQLKQRLAPLSYWAKEHHRREKFELTHSTALPDLAYSTEPPSTLPFGP